MNTGQTLLVTVGLLLFTTFVLTVYRSITSKFSFAIANEAILSGTGLAQSMIDEISLKNFDEKTINSVVTVSDSLTPPNSLGPDANEFEITLFDDLDDFNDFVKKDTLSRIGIFQTKVKIYYVNPNNPDQYTNSQTFAKRIEVFVLNDLITDTIKMYRVVTY